MSKNRITKIYTKAGDKGKTALVGGEKVSKASLRVDAYGEVDELNTVIGMAICELGEEEEIKGLLQKIQNDLFIMGGDLATKMDSAIEVPTVSAYMCEFLEKKIDQFVLEVGSLREFILPCGGRAATNLHLARAVCRRAERKVVALMEVERINENILIYLNRLSDLLFALVRVVNKRDGIQELYVDFNKR